MSTQYFKKSIDFKAKNVINICNIKDTLFIYFNNINAYGHFKTY